MKDHKLAVNVKSGGGYEALDFVLSFLEHKFVPEWDRSSSSFGKEPPGGALIRTMIKGPSLPHFHLALAASRHGQA